MKTLGKILGGIVLVCLMILATIFVFSTQTLNKKIEYSDASPPIPKDSASIARGRHLSRAISKCVDCHGDDFGGQVVFDALPMARVVAPNLTTGRGGIAGDRTDDDLLRAIRHGIGVGGRALVLMPVRDYWHMGDADVGSLIAYLRTLPAVDRELPATSFGLVGRVLLLKGDLAGMFDAKQLDHLARRSAPPAADTTADYGRYLAEIGGCTGCHGPTLSGGAIPGMPPEARPARNITPEGIGSWTEQDFFKALREGIRPDGTPLDSMQMPVRLTREMTDAETRAIYLFLRTVPPKATGGR
ncbi:MAG TPA: c-type cytochrome [Gemmatimonadaceae bacterium]